MLRSTPSARRKPARRLASVLALSAALAVGGVAGGAIFPTSVQAQEYSDGFVAVYQPVADAVNAEGADIASLQGQLPAVVAAAQTPDDQYAAGSLLLTAGNKAENAQLQRQGLELMVNSGKTVPEQLGQFNWFIGSLAFQAEDYGAAREALQAAKQAGYSGPDVDIEGLIAESYFSEGDGQGGIAYVKQAADERKAAGGQVPERWLLQSLQTAYDMNMAGEATEISAMLIENYPTERNWINTLQVIAAINDFEPQQQLDLLRLMRETGALTQRSEYVRYIEAADPRIMANEVEDVLGAAVAAGEIATGDTYYTEVKSIVDQRAPIDRAEAPSMVRDAESSSDGSLAEDAADVAYSLDDFAQAETLYQLALDKGVADRDTVLTRLGIAQAKQGKFTEAQATFEQVGGNRVPIAQMWSLYARTQMG